MIDKFFDNTAKSIELVQKQFDEYQNKFFPMRTPEFFCLELNGEAGELANLEKKQWKGKEIPKEQFDDEAADVFIALMNYANSRGVNLSLAVLNKLKHIEQRRSELNANGLEY